MSLQPDMFIGTWSLNSWRIEYEDGNITYPFGEHAIGRIAYSSDNQMSATISAAGRSKPGQGNVRNWPDLSKIEAFESYFHYAGQWHIENDHVVHVVDFSLNPGFVGSQQRRLAEFNGANALRLSAKEKLKSGGSRHHILEWEK